jgi:hypothetical protein
MSYTLISIIVRRFRILVVGKVRMDCYMCQSQVQADAASTIESFWKVIARRLCLQIGYAGVSPTIPHWFVWSIKLIAPLGERRDWNTRPEQPMSTLGLLHTTTAIS